MKEILEASLAMRRVLEAELQPSRGLSLALTKLEECAMWAGNEYCAQNGLPQALDEAGVLAARLSR